MKLEEVLSAPFVEDLTPGPLKDQVREILEAFGDREELGQLQVQACCDDLVSRKGLHVRRGFAFVEARMLGLLEPAFVMGILKDGGVPPEHVGQPIRLVLVYVGTPVPSSAERKLLSRLRTAIKDEAWVKRLGRAKSLTEAKEILREVDRTLTTSPDLEGRKTAKSCHAELRISIRGDRLVEECLRSAILGCGAAVEGVERGRASNGEREERITISFDRGRSLDEIVRAVGKVEGVAVRTVSLFASAPDSRPA